MAPDITVIIATYNRAQELARTLEGLARTENGGLAVEFVVVDNGSTDQTKLSVDSFSDRIPIEYIFEPHAGKNRALNTALEKCRLGKIVVFTDDDVDVSPDWLVSIHSVCDRWPNHSVFGGRINVLFPIAKVPKWTSDLYLSSLCFAQHSYSNKECIYGHLETPYGPNFWVRREVFDCGRRFNEAIGPRPTNRIMGSETSFLVALLKDNYEIVYTPTVVVSHRVQIGTLKFSGICLRGYRLGRGEAHYFGLPGQALLRKNFILWRLYRNGSIFWYGLRVITSFIFSKKDQRRRNVVEKMQGLGYRVEAVRLANQVLNQLREQS
jgi:glycosyltransferase involved in cell wall biosynthesis